MKNLSRAFVLLLFIGSTGISYAETKAFFSPNGGCQEAIIAEIGKARQSIDVAMYAFTSRDIAHALLAAKEHGVKVKIVLDPSELKDHYSKSKYLVHKGFDVKFHLGPGLMHDKFALIDERTILTGSFNWTATAEKKNAENLLVISDKGLAHQYAKEFKHLWSQSGEGQFKDPKESPSQAE